MNSKRKIIGAMFIACLMILQSCTAGSGVVTSTNDVCTSLPASLVTTVIEEESSEPITDITTQIQTDTQTEIITETTTEIQTDAQTEATTAIQTEATTAVQTEIRTSPVTKPITTPQTEPMTTPITSAETKAPEQTQKPKDTEPVGAADYFDVMYKTESYTFIGRDIELYSAYHDEHGELHDVTWSTLTPNVASVDANGCVHPISTGVAAIRASYDSTHFLDFTVTVLDEKVSDELAFILKNHNSNALTVYNLPVISTSSTYYYDVVGGVNNLLFADLIIDRTYYGKWASGEKNYGEIPSVEFVCIHSTGNTDKGADADNHGAYFNKDNCSVSIHYITGRSNLPTYGGKWSENSYVAVASLNEKYAAWHAYTKENQCVWDKSGVKATENDPETPIISISNDLYYTINGIRTEIAIPTPPSGYKINGSAMVVNKKVYSAINQMGLITKIVDGEYYLARTWWGNSQYPACLTTYGGNMNSIGIETCVDIGSDLMHTWHVTAQLTADILNRYNLGFDRVVGHNFFSGKTCPQPLLENDMQLWDVFMDMVRAEYERQTTYKDVKISAKVISGQEILSDKGLLRQNENANIVTYEVTIEKNGKTESVILSTAVESNKSYTGERTKPSLQNQNYDIK